MSRHFSREQAVRPIAGEHPKRLAGRSVEPFQADSLDPLRCAFHSSDDEIERSADLNRHRDAKCLGVSVQPEFPLRLSQRGEEQIRSRLTDLLDEPLVIFRGHRSEVGGTRSGDRQAGIPLRENLRCGFRHAGHPAQKIDAVALPGGPLAQRVYQIRAGDSFA